MEKFMLMNTNLNVCTQQAPAIDSSAESRPSNLLAVQPELCTMMRRHQGCHRRHFFLISETGRFLPTPQIRYAGRGSKVGKSGTRRGIFILTSPSFDQLKLCMVNCLFGPNTPRTLKSSFDTFSTSRIGSSLATINGPG